jgi:hypothetical protein
MVTTICHSKGYTPRLRGGRQRGEKRWMGEKEGRLWQRRREVMAGQESNCIEKRRHTSAMIGGRQRKVKRRQGGAVAR